MAGALGFPLASTSADTMNEADDIYAALRALSERMIEQRREERERARLATNALRRERAAARRANGTPSTRPATPQYEPEYEPDSPRSCYCHAAMFPPCGWCQDGHHDEEDDDQI